MRISDWSSDVCSSDLRPRRRIEGAARPARRCKRHGRAVQGDGLHRAGLARARRIYRRRRMTLIQLAKPADAEAIAAFANGSFTHTLGHIYDPADLSAFLAGWNPPDRVRAQIASDDYDIALGRGAARSEEHTYEHQSKIHHL